MVRELSDYGLSVSTRLFVTYIVRNTTTRRYMGIIVNTPTNL